MAQSLAEQRHATPVERFWELLGQASAGTGTHKPVLSGSRDGITRGLRGKGGAVFEVATTATVSILDRRGRRGSGVTEADCKTVDTQRLKLSGMRREKGRGTDDSAPASPPMERRLGHRR